MNRLKLSLLLLSSLIFSQKTYSQDAGLYCCLMPIAIIASSYNVSLQYGVVNNDSLGQGQLIGIDIAFYPIQCPGFHDGNVLVGLKGSVLRAFGNGGNKFMKSALIEFNYYLKKKEKPKAIFGSYIGTDIGITNGLDREKMDDLLIAPRIGIYYYLVSGFLVLNMETKYLYIKEAPVTKGFSFSLGLQITFCP